MKRKTLKPMTDLIFYVVGASIYSVAVNMFLSPNAISPGGFTGIAAVINHFTAAPTGIMLFILNIPVLILGYIKMGGIFILKTSFVTALTSFALDISASFLPQIKVDEILAAMFGGILMGLGLSFILLRGATTGGVDIVAKLINKRYSHFSVGKIILIFDGMVIVLNAIVYKNAQSALYSIVAMYTATKIMDILLYGADKGKIIYVITKDPDMVCKEINHTVGRGVTRLSVVGGYTGKTRSMLMCIVRVHEVAAVKNAIKTYDSGAFVVVSDAGEIIGEGFKLH